MTPVVSNDASAHACRNCGADARGAYCPVCGQETRVALPNARQFLRDAAGRYVALDGRMWRTLFGLLLRPGFLTREYLAGRRRRYVRPARLFLVLSVAVFALFRVISEPPIFVTSDAPVAKQGALRPDGEGFDVSLDNKLNVSVKGIDGVMPALLKQRVDHFNQLPGREKIAQIFDGAMRYGPYALLGLLPAFALLLQIAYLGPRRRYPLRPHRYAEHLVFAAHNHSFLCLALMLAAIPVPAFRGALALWIAVYFLWSMKAVYGGRWSGVVARGLVVAFAYAVLFVIVTAGLIVAAVVLR